MNCCCTKAPLIVSIGEDATRIIGRVDYDSQTDRLVGFVMPVNKLGLPVTDTYLATSFITIEKFFSTSTVAKHAFLYGPAIITISTCIYISLFQLLYNRACAQKMDRHTFSLNVIKGVLKWQALEPMVTPES